MSTEIIRGHLNIAYILISELFPPLADYLPLKCSVANIAVLFVFVHKQYNILSSFYCLHESEKMITTK